MQPSGETEQCGCLSKGLVLPFIKPSRMSSAF